MGAKNRRSLRRKCPPSSKPIEVGARRNRVHSADREPFEEGPTRWTADRKAEQLGPGVKVKGQTCPKMERAGKRVGFEDAGDQLSILLFKGLITDRQREAGRIFAALRMTVFGSAHVRSAAFREMISETITSDSEALELLLDDEREDRAERRQRKYRDANRALVDAGMEARAAVWHAAVYDDPPRDMADLVRGLDALARLWRLHAQ